MLISRRLIIILCLALSFGLGFSLAWPKYKDLRTIREEMKKKAQEVSYQDKYLSDLKEASEKLKQYGQALQKIDSALPPSPDLPVLFEYLQKTSSQNGLVLKGATPSVNESDETAGKEIVFSLSLSGAYNSLKSFLEAMSKTSRFIKIESIAFSSPAKGDIFDFNVEIKMYSY